MAQVDQIVSACSQELVTLLQGVTEIADKTLEVYDNDQFLATVDELNLPLVGVVYSGLRPIEAKRGMVAEVIFDLVLVGGERCRSATSAIDGRATNLSLLDQMRDTIMLQHGPGERYWRFLQEGPVPDMHPSAMGYIQRWATAVPLTQTN